jgi:hypothetical protein
VREIRPASVSAESRSESTESLIAPIERESSLNPAGPAAISVTTEARDVAAERKGRTMMVDGFAALFDAARAQDASRGARGGRDGYTIPDEVID